LIRVLALALCFVVTLLRRNFGFCSVRVLVLNAPVACIKWYFVFMMEFIGEIVVS
jgi:hypothetical protein